MGRIYTLKSTQAPKFQSIVDTLGLRTATMSDYMCHMIEVIPESIEMHDALTTIVDYLNNQK